MRQTLFLFLWTLIFFNLAHADTIYLTGIKVVESRDMTGIKFALSAETSYKIFLLDNPRRIVVDLQNTKSRVDLKSLSVPGIKSMRSGHPRDGIERLVLDLTYRSHYHSFYDKNSNELNLVLKFKVDPIPSYAKLSEPKNKITTPETAAVLHAKEQVHKKNMVIVIDPGHGGKDVGALGKNGIQEKQVVLAIAKKLADLINAQPNMQAVLTRSDDYFVPLRNRLKLARRGKADLFIAIHADAYFNNNASGASVYALSRRGATSEAARWIAKRDNTSELGGVDLGELGDQSFMLRSVLIDLAQTATIADSLHLGNSILSALDNITKLHYSRVEQAPFVVLKSPDIPSVLVETGFISNSREEAHLNDKGYQNKLAGALFVGVQAYLKKYPQGV